LAGRWRRRFDRRKIIVDTYGGYSRHGAVLSLARIRRRWIAPPATWHDTSRKYRGCGLASKTEVQLAYAIGVAEPVSVMADTFGTATVSEEKITS